MALRRMNQEFWATSKSHWKAERKGSEREGLWFSFLSFVSTHFSLKFMRASLFSAMAKKSSSSACVGIFGLQRELASDVGLEAEPMSSDSAPPTSLDGVLSLLQKFQESRR